MAKIPLMTHVRRRSCGRAGLSALINTVASCLAAAGLLVLPVLAQEATPSADRFAFAERRLIDPRECVVAPLPAETIAQVLHLEDGGISKPAVPAVPSPLGQVADSHTRTAIEGAVRELIACFNAQDIQRAAALMTERGVQCLYWTWTVDQPARAAMQSRLQAPPHARAPDLAIRLIAVTDVSLMSDGREAAFVIVNDPSHPPPGPETVLVLFTRYDDAWLLDDWVTFAFVPVSAIEATPAP